MVPDLTTDERSKYIAQEFDRVHEMLDGAEDCKWIYQSLIHLSKLHKSFTAEWPAKADLVRQWIDELLRLDPLRAGRWNDLNSDLENW